MDMMNLSPSFSVSSMETPLTDAVRKKSENTIVTVNSDIIAVSKKSETADNNFFILLAECKELEVL